MTPRRVLHITPTYDPKIGGIEDVVFNLTVLSRKAGSLTAACVASN